MRHVAGPGQQMTAARALKQVCDCHILASPSLHLLQFKCVLSETAQPGSIIFLWGDLTRDFQNGASPPLFT